MSYFPPTIILIAINSKFYITYTVIGIKECNIDTDGLISIESDLIFLIQLQSSLLE